MTMPAVLVTALNLVAIGRCSVMLCRGSVSLRRAHRQLQRLDDSRVAERVQRRELSMRRVSFACVCNPR